jgi:hypothetical protein
MTGKKGTGKVLAVLLVAVCCGASYSCFTMKYSTTGASLPPEAKTVSVQYVENQARNVESGLSQQVTDALKDYIQANTNLIMVNTNGDIDFEGVITGFDVRPAAIVSGDEAAKNRFTITLKMKFTCTVKPEIDYESSFSRYEDYDSNLDFETAKANLTGDILKLLIEDVYNKAFVNW